MNYHAFPALLQANYNGTRVFGTAQIYDTQQNTSGINFYSEFIPLLPLGTAATISWIHGEDEIAAFAGNVYLSSLGRVRLVDINSALLQDARSTFATNVNIPALYRAAESAQSTTACQIIYLDTEYITIKTTLPKEDSPHIFLSCEVDFLTLDCLEIKVIHQLNLSAGETLLFCQIMKTGNYNLIALSAYAARLERLA